MSIQALKWVMEDAPVEKSCWLPVLYGLANGADEDGKGSRASQATLAHFARKTVRAVQKDLAALERAGLIRRGNQALVSHLPLDRRPMVWDLALERLRNDPRPAKQHPTGTSAGVAKPQLNRGEPRFTPVVDNQATGANYGTGPGRTTVRTNLPLNQEPPPSPRAAARTRDPLTEAEEAEDFEKATTIIAAEELVASLPGPLSQGQQRQLVPVVTAALEAGWPPKELHKELTVDVGTARSRYAVYAHRLGPLPASRPPARPAPPSATHSRPQHEFEPDAYGKSCTRCHTAKTNTVHIARGAPESITA